MKNGYSQGDMKPTVENMQKPESCYAEKYDQAPLNYIDRQNSTQKKAAGKLKSESFKGRYDK